MKRITLVITAIMICGISSAQSGGVRRGPQNEPLPEGFKPASTNTFSSQYPAVNPITRQAMFRILAPAAQSVQLQLGGNYDMAKDEKGTWWITTDPLVVGFHYYAILIDGVAVMDPGSEAYFGYSRENA
jgi:1,4-alpha-glucan branching enzyme